MVVVSNFAVSLVVSTLAFGNLRYLTTHNSKPINLTQPFKTAAGDQSAGVTRPVNLYDDIRRKIVVLLKPDSITGLYTRVAPKYKWPGGVLYWGYDPTNDHSQLTSFQF
jgi:hypothetical protein